MTSNSAPVRLMDVCASCDYSLEGLPDTGVCPECGATYNQSRITLVGAGAGSLASLWNGSRRMLTRACFAMLFFLGVFFYSNRSTRPLLPIVLYIAVYATIIVARSFSQRRGFVQVFLWPEGI